MLISEGQGGGGKWAINYDDQRHEMQTTQEIQIPLLRNDLTVSPLYKDAAMRNWE